MGSIKTTINQTMSIDGEDTGYFGVSKTKKGIKLPDKTFTYGRPNHCIDGGAQEAMQYLVLQKTRNPKSTRKIQKSHFRIQRFRQTKPNRSQIRTCHISRAKTRNGNASQKSHQKNQIPVKTMSPMSE